MEPATGDPNPIYLRYDRFYELPAVGVNGALTALHAGSTESLANTNLPIAKTDQAYLIPTYTQQGHPFTKPLLAAEAMR